MQWRGRLLMVVRRVVSRAARKAVQVLARNPARPVARRAVGRPALTSRVAAVVEVLVAELRSRMQVVEVVRLRSRMQVAEVLAAGLPHRRLPHRRVLLLLVPHRRVLLPARANQPRHSCSPLSAARWVCLPCGPCGGDHVAQIACGRPAEGRGDEICRCR